MGRTLSHAAAAEGEGAQVKIVGSRPERMVSVAVLRLVQETRVYLEPVRVQSALERPHELDGALVDTPTVQWSEKVEV